MLSLWFVFLFEINALRVFVFVCSCGEERKNNMLQVILFLNFNSLRFIYR